MMTLFVSGHVERSKKIVSVGGSWEVELKMSLYFPAILRPGSWIIESIRKTDCSSSLQISILNGLGLE